MRKWFLGLAGVAAAGTVFGLKTKAPERTVMHYSWGVVTVVHGDVTQICKDEGVRFTDDGKPLSSSTKILACASRRGDGCHIVLSLDNPTSLTHELAHCDGFSDPKKAGFDWPTKKPMVDWPTNTIKYWGGGSQ